MYRPDLHDRGIIDLQENFLIDIVQQDRREHDQLHLYQIPSGPLNARVGHLFHWPPWYTSSKSFSSLDWDLSPSLEFAESLFPTIRGLHLCTDLWAKKTVAKDPITNRRLSDSELYLNDPLLPLHKNQVCRLFESAIFLKVLVVWGEHAGDHIKESYLIDPAAKYEIIDGVDIGGRKCSVVFLPHPSYLARWATSNTVPEQVKDILERLFVEYDVLVNTSALSSTMPPKLDLDSLDDAHRKKIEHQRAERENNREQQNADRQINRRATKELADYGDETMARRVEGWRESSRKHYAKASAELRRKIEAGDSVAIAA